jgi:hypothetical protein
VECHHHGRLRAREAGSLERFRGPDAEGVRRLKRVSTGDLGRGVAHVTWTAESAA